MADQTPTPVLSQSPAPSLSPALVPTAPREVNDTEPIPPPTGIFTVADQQVLDAVSSPKQPIPFQRKVLVNNQTTPLFTVDMTKIP